MFLVATLSMHSTEVAPAQTLPILVHRLATADDETSGRWLDDVVIMVVACLNPDGKIPTPHMDRIGREGMIYTDAHASSAVCTPSTASRSICFPARSSRWSGRSSADGGRVMTRSGIASPSVLR